MISPPEYLMEHEGETVRLEKKTNVSVVREQALWAGITPGMRVADIGCGTGKTTHALHQLVQPGGEVVGLDISAQRLAYATQNYKTDNIHFLQRDVNQPLEDLGLFDFVWVRFFLEYHKSRAFEIVQNLARITRPGGIMCLIDLDYNCLNHFGMPDRLSRTLSACMKKLEQGADFDPYIGIKLYSFLYDLKFENIDVHMAPHHLIYGKITEIEEFNWASKVDMAVRRSAVDFTDYPGGYTEFFEEFKKFFADPRRFSYTPLIACRGRKLLQ
jgi:ubiquinone/menaquinone biosynthesis C-methylase UbiE